MQDFDPLAPETLESPYEEFHRLRKSCPVAHTDAWGGYWSITRHDDVEAVASDSAQYVTSVQNVIPKVAFTGRRPPLHLDPPEHTPYRKAIAPLLTARRIEAFRPLVRQLCEELLAPMLAAGGGDICEMYSAVLPIRVFAHWMNLAQEDADLLAEVGRRYNFAVQESDEEATRESSAILYELARRIVSDRQQHLLPVESDATSALLASQFEGEPLPAELVVGTIRQVLVVGIIAPTVFFGSVAVHLARDLALQEQLRSDPGLVPAAIEEFLRLYTPYRGFARTSVSDVTLRGRTITAGEPIAVCYAAANRDPEVFPDPDEFRLDRPNMKASLAFGRGPHNCVGAAMARLQMTTALEVLLQSTRTFELSGEVKVTRMPEIGALRVPLVFT
ncbi:cytochrome P450 [Parahaliea maris]|uniref:Cytochrome P450 n=1 Tax=Parahaliea maris TaxID=2716870 RepID=A0A5C8ZP49_9GAMM|nr:cytochrome P450 [Parahaliea maris]TXS90263.1 cytochrome P450 [Parahaliea maris]